MAKDAGGYQFHNANTHKFIINVFAAHLCRASLYISGQFNVKYEANLDSQNEFYGVFVYIMYIENRITSSKPQLLTNCTKVVCW